IPTHCEIQDNKEWMVVHPARPVRQVGGRARSIEMLVHVKTNFVRLPFHSKHVELIAESPAAGQGERRTDPVLSRIAGPVDSAVSDGGLAAQVLDDVDLAASWPASACDVISEHPERGPDALAARHFDSCFEASVGLRKVALRLESSRRVLAGNSVSPCVRLANRLDYQSSMRLTHILRSCRVVFKLVVAPSVAAGFRSPLLGIDRRAIWGVEFIAPGEDPFTVRFRFRCKREWTNYQESQEREAEPCSRFSLRRQFSPRDSIHPDAPPAASRSHSPSQT